MSEGNLREHDGRTPPGNDWLERDLDVYCYLKQRLPHGYRIRAEPSAAYFSEWGYRYLVFRGHTLVAELTGDFRTLEPGALVLEARELLASLERDPC
jgi:hypothetical protein